MKFETKYLIRWGIPGWVFATWLFIVLCITVDDFTKLLTDPQNFSKVLGILITLLSLGVPIGYLFQQLYFAWEWNDNKKKFLLIKRDDENTKKILWFIDLKSVKDADKLKPIKEVLDKYESLKDYPKNFPDDYYYIESLWHKLLINADKEKHDYIIGRFRYFLSTIHGLGSLMYSLCSSAMIIIFVWRKFAEGDNQNWSLGILLFIHVLLILGIYKNYHYYSKNSITFQAFFIEEMLEAEKKKETENEATPQEQCKHTIVLEIKAPG
ncbi:hypothetical protein [Priestia aryabhattai]|uniref:hypothetical protein n=1 Tax=Priestia aryabhattai TaxID=412384 RepID=UPI002E21C540|nr:hypothetical protein [Priestia aryabhattai]